MLLLWGISAQNMAFSKEEIQSNGWGSHGPLLNPPQIPVIAPVCMCGGEGTNLPCSSHLSDMTGSCICLPTSRCCFIYQRPSVEEMADFLSTVYCTRYTIYYCTVYTKGLYTSAFSQVQKELNFYWLKESYCSQKVILLSLTLNDFLPWSNETCSISSL